MFRANMSFGTNISDSVVTEHQKLRLLKKLLFQVGLHWNLYLQEAGCVEAMEETREMMVKEDLNNTHHISRPLDNDVFVEHFLCHF